MALMVDAIREKQEDGKCSGGVVVKLNSVRGILMACNGDKVCDIAKKKYESG